MGRWSNYLDNSSQKTRIPHVIASIFWIFQWRGCFDWNHLSNCHRFPLHFVCVNTAVVWLTFFFSFKSPFWKSPFFKIKTPAQELCTWTHFSGPSIWPAAFQWKRQGSELIFLIFGLKKLVSGSSEISRQRQKTIDSNQANTMKSCTWKKLVFTCI